MLYQIQHVKRLEGHIHTHGYFRTKAVVTYDFPYVPVMLSNWVRGQNELRFLRQ